jgi:hypothetical protein
MAVHEDRFASVPDVSDVQVLEPPVPVEEP